MTCSPSWLRRLDKPKLCDATDTCVPLLWGSVVGDTKGREVVENPVAWTNTCTWADTCTGGRVFYTSLGHPQDFEVASFRTLLVSGIRWALGDL